MAKACQVLHSMASVAVLTWGWFMQWYWYWSTPPPSVGRAQPYCIWVPEWCLKTISLMILQYKKKSANVLSCLDWGLPRRLVRHTSCCVWIYREWIYRENWPKAKTLMSAGCESDEIKGEGREILLVQTSCLFAPCPPWSELLCLAMFSRPRWNRNLAIMGQYTSSSLNYVFSGVTVMTSDQHKLGSHFCFLTARDAGRMGDSKTRKGLKTWKFQTEADSPKGDGGGNTLDRCVPNSPHRLGMSLK